MNPELATKQLMMDLAADANQEMLAFARRAAVEIAKSKGEVSIDDVRERLGLYGPIKNWAGSVFRGSQWVCIGFIPASHHGSHARMIRKWKLRENFLS